MDAAFDVREQSGHTLKSSLKYTNIIDRRDHNNLPTAGGYLKTSAEFAGLGGDVNFLRFNFDYQYTKTFFDYFVRSKITSVDRMEFLIKAFSKKTTQLTVSKGVVTPWKRDGKVLISDKFFLGGPLSLRGFENRGVGPNSESRPFFLFFIRNFNLLLIQLIPIPILQRLCSRQ
jgi:outer membrane protein insertion porin family